jgi:hypothetical protein
MNLDCVWSKITTVPMSCVAPCTKNEINAHRNQQNRPLRNFRKHSPMIHNTKSRISASWLNKVSLLVLMNEYDENKLVMQIKSDGGHDFLDISDSDILSLKMGQFKGDWNSVAFAFSELLAFYSVYFGDCKFTKEQVVSWFFASMVMAEAINRDFAHWEFHFRNILNVCCVIRNEVDDEIWVDFFKLILSGK